MGARPSYEPCVSPGKRWEQNYSPPRYKTFLLTALREVPCFPDLELARRRENSELKKAKLRIVAFWADWCRPAAELPVLEQLESARHRIGTGDYQGQTLRP